MEFNDRLAQVKNSAEGRWGHILFYFCPQLHDAIDSHGTRRIACPVHGGNSGKAFRLFPDFAIEGGGVCNTCGAFPDGIGLIAWINNTTYGKALHDIATFLELRATPDKPTPPVRSARREPPCPSVPDKNKHEENIRLWRETVDPDDERSGPLWSYLGNRGLVLNTLPVAMRLHPRLSYFEPDPTSEKSVLIGHFPAILSLVSGPHGRPVTLHRTYLTDSGYKAPVASPKKLLPAARQGAMRGGAIRLFSAIGPTLGVAEGIETALAAWAATGIPTWAAVSANLLEQMIWPAHIKHLLIWADRDNNQCGQRAAQTLAQRAMAAGLLVDVFLPPGPIGADAKGIDWHDVYVRQGPHAFPRPWINPGGTQAQLQADDSLIALQHQAG